MAYEPPEDLVDLKARWYAAKAAADRIAAEEPAEPVDEQDRDARTITAAPRSAAEQPKTILIPTEEQMARLNAARAEVTELTMAVHRHPWKREQDDVHEAEKALNAIALKRYQASLAGA